MRVRTPKNKPTGTPKPTGGIRGATQAQLSQIRQRQQSAKPITPAQRAAIQKARAAAGNMIPQSKPPTSQQKAAMRKQMIARRGNTAKQQVKTEAVGRRLVRKGDATPGQVRSYKMARQKFRQGKFAPKRTTKKTSRRLV